MTTTLPQVGARVRVTRTYPSGTRSIREGIVTAVRPDERYPSVDLAGDLLVNLHDIGESTVTVEVLEPPLPAEPPMGRIVQVGTSLFRRGRDNLGYEYAELTEDGPPRRTWAYVCSLGTPVTLVPAPNLAELAVLAETWPFGQDGHLWQDHEKRDFARWLREQGTT